MTGKIIAKAREWIKPEEDYRDNMHLKVNWLIVYAYIAMNPAVGQQIFDKDMLVCPERLLQEHIDIILIIGLILNFS